MWDVVCGVGCAVWGMGVVWYRVVLCVVWYGVWCVVSGV